jgi:hypothetical protein
MDMMLCWGASSVGFFWVQVTLNAGVFVYFCHFSPSQLKFSPSKKCVNVKKTELFMWFVLHMQLMVHLPSTISPDTLLFESNGYVFVMC